ncbi:MAG: radical SAM family heme chaperone HemW [Bacteroidaceae bacterium]|nr:radical SAM family heme chaperone HemW [Bacteroidaceae bacterium]
MPGIYLHIPFCKTRCIYCNFYSTTRDELITQYIQALCLELKLRNNYLNGAPIETIYIGGGTPSQLSEKDFQLIFETLQTYYDIDKCKEITLEANPDDLSTTYLSMLKRFPFNRISMGIQTFDDFSLKMLNRRHNALEAIEAVKNCRAAGFKNISIDLIYGLPGENIEKWENDLNQAIALQPEHISAYLLTYEKATPIYNMLQKHQISEVDEETSVQLFSLLIDKLQAAGYVHYEISNFCLPGYHSRHNSSYWESIPYLGCGPSAHSFNGNSREWNISSLDLYIKGIEEGHREYEKEQLNLNTRYNEYIITSLRTMKGISLKALKEEYGNILWQYCLKMATPHLKNKKMIIQKDYLHLTRTGIFISNGIISDLLWVD